MISGSLILMCVAAAMGQRDLSVDCSSGDSVSVRWRPALDLPQKLDPSKALLGNCPPSFMPSEDTLVFYVSLHDCGFIRQVNADRLTFSNMLLYDQRPDLPFVSQAVECVYDSSAIKPTAPVKEEDQDDGQETFIMEIMDSEFSAPAPSSVFSPSSRIPVRAAVVSRRPLRIYMDSCVIATHADLGRATHTLPIVTNAGCLVGSKSGNSSFVRRRAPEELLLFLDASSFSAGQTLFLVCDLEAWDSQSLGLEQKACQFLQGPRRWELLDAPSQSYACSCCDSTCPWSSSARAGVSVRKVLGPLVLSADESRSSGTEHGLSSAPVWLLLVAVATGLLLLMGVVAVGYYLCVWRGGRIGYRPSRDLLTKY